MRRWCTFISNGIYTAPLSLSSVYFQSELYPLFFICVVENECIFSETLEFCDCEIFCLNSIWKKMNSKKIIMSPPRAVQFLNDFFFSFKQKIETYVYQKCRNFSSDSKTYHHRCKNTETTFEIRNFGQCLQTIQ